MLNKADEAKAVGRVVPYVQLPSSAERTTDAFDRQLQAGASSQFEGREGHTHSSRSVMSPQPGSSRRSAIARRSPWPIPDKWPRSSEVLPQMLFPWRGPHPCSCTPHRDTFWRNRADHLAHQIGARGLASRTAANTTTPPPLKVWPPLLVISSVSQGPRRLNKLPDHGRGSPGRSSSTVRRAGFRNGAGLGGRPDSNRGKSSSLSLSHN